MSMIDHGTALVRLALVSLLALTFVHIRPSVAADWPVWRGPNGDGIVMDRSIPTQWSVKENIAWSVGVPGVGHSSPVVANGRIFLTSYDAESNGRLLLCFDRKDGSPLWSRTVLNAAAEKMHKNNTPASSTPATDGSHVWVTFLDGNKVTVACYDFAGNQMWLKAFPGFTSTHGFCSSPVLFGDLLIVNGDSDGDAFVAALNIKSGETKWKVNRPNRTRSFSVPLFVNVKGKTQMILAGSKSITGFEPETGKVLWVANSVTDKFVATAAYTEGLVFATGTSPNNSLVALDPTGTGDITKTHIRWYDTKVAAYVPSPIAFKNRLFIVSDAGVATLLDAKTGKTIWSERIGGSRLHHASPLLINGLIYCSATDGTTTVLKFNDEFEIVSKNQLQDELHATPAVSDGHLFIRTTTKLWCIGEKRK